MTGLALIVPRLAAAAGAAVQVPIGFQGGGSQIAATVFSIDFDQNWLTFSHVTFSVPSDFAAGVTPDLGDPDGELDFSILDFMTPLAALPDGALVTITFTTGRPAQATEAHVKFSASPPASFGSTGGQSVPGKTVDGAVIIQP